MYGASIETRMRCWDYALELVLATQLVLATECPLQLVLCPQQPMVDTCQFHVQRINHGAIGAHQQLRMSLWHEAWASTSGEQRSEAHAEVVTVRDE